MLISFWIYILYMYIVYWAQCCYRYYYVYTIVVHFFEAIQIHWGFGLQTANQPTAITIHYIVSGPYVISLPKAFIYMKFSSRFFFIRSFIHSFYFVSMEPAKNGFLFSTIVLLFFPLSICLFFHFRFCSLFENGLCMYFWRAVGSTNKTIPSTNRLFVVCLFHFKFFFGPCCLIYPCQSIFSKS